MRDRENDRHPANAGGNYINHIALVLDASASMAGLARDVIRVADAEIAYLARRSRELDQETRVTVYTFGYAADVRCLFYDKDVLRLPSLAGHYRANGMTALIDATMRSQEELGETATRYGDHAFLTYVLTDGQENNSRRWSAGDLAGHIARQPDNWTVACLVPDQCGAFEAKRFGFPADNVAVWDATRSRGVHEAFESTIRTATETFMTNRTLGVRGSKTLFAGGAAQVNTRNVNAATGFRPLPRDAYVLCQAAADLPEAIRPFVELVTNAEYRTGSAYYQLTKPEKIQPQKEVLVRNRKSGRVYRGPDARKLLGLPDHEVRVKPEDNAEFQIFVQSTSVNRKLVPGTKVLVLT